MKIKQDFVTNSSSTCYVMYGVKMLREELFSKLPKHMWEHFFNEGAVGHYKPEDLNSDDQELIEELHREFIYEELIFNKNLDLLIADNAWEEDQMLASHIYIGLGPSKIADSETVGEYKARVATMINEFLNTNFTSEDLKLFDVQTCGEQQADMCY